MATALRLVGAPEDRPPSTDYEWQERQRIGARDWAAIHIAADRRAPIMLPDRIRRLWR